MIKFNEIKKTSKLSEVQYYQVVDVKNNELVLSNDYGEKISVSRSYVESCLISSDQFNSEEKKTKTELAEIFLSNPGVIMTVNYHKQVDKDAVKKEIANLYPNKGGKILAEKDYVKKVNDLLKTALEGEERTAVGRHSSGRDDFGRVHFIDMEKEKDKNKSYDTRQILVDPRTINWLIIRGIKYSKK